MNTTTLATRRADLRKAAIAHLAHPDYGSQRCQKAKPLTKRPINTAKIEQPSSVNAAKSKAGLAASDLLERNPFWHSQALCRIQERFQWRGIKGKKLARAMAEVTEAAILEEGRRYAL